MREAPWGQSLLWGCLVENSPEVGRRALAGGYQALVRPWKIFCELSWKTCYLEVSPGNPKS